MSALVVVEGVLVESEANRREHWGKRDRRRAKQQLAVTTAWRTQKPEVRLPCVVTLCAYRPRLLDDDNLVGGFKWIRDSVARLLGCGDSPTDPVTWRYEQAKSRDACVVIEVASLSGSGVV